jgi:hypothetical protein
VLLGQRRTELGYTHLPAFARARLPLTPSGNPNTRLLADIEKAYRDNFPEVRLRQLAHAYLVAYESLVAVAHLRSRALVPVPPAGPAAPVVPAEPPGWMPPMTDPARTASARPYADRIWDRLRLLAIRGITDPDGTQVFLRAAADPRDYDGIGTPADAKAWDGTGERLDLPGRVWLIADMQRRDAGRGGSGTGTARA